MRKKLSGRMTTEGMIESLMNPEVDPEKAGAIGRNLWTIGLNMVAIRHRIEREEKEIRERSKLSMTEASKRRSPSRTTVNRIKSRRYA